MRKCEWCGTEFWPNNHDQAYCKPTHAKKANAKRRKAKVELENAGKCPTPYKRSWSSVEQAQLFNLPADQYIYHCRCGALHAATQKPRVKAAA